MADITSVNNNIVRKLCALAQPKGRREHGCYIIEGRKLLAEALEADAHLDAVILDDARCGELAPLLRARGVPVYTAAPHVMKKVSDTKAPQGVVAAVRIPSERKPDFPMVILDGVQDPGNCGTIWRTCEAAGFASIAFLPGCADMYSPKVVRATMGSALRVPAFAHGTEYLGDLREQCVTLITASLSGISPAELPILTGPYALVVGSEARGVSAEAMALSQYHLRIPMRGRLESLNAAIAAALLMYAIEFRK